MELAAIRNLGGGRERDDRADRAERPKRRSLASRPERPERDTAMLQPEHWAAEALVALWEANRADGEPYGDCFARLGVPRYTTLLDQVMNPAA